MKKLIIDEKYDKKKLHTVLQNVFPDLLLNTIYKTLRKKDIKVNGKRINTDIELHAGDIVEVYIIDSLLYKQVDYKIVYDDEYILIVDKPSNLEVTGENSLTSILLSDLKTVVYPCHRLDRNTTGLVLFARTKEALNILLEKFKNSEISKHYIAHVFGIPKEHSKTLTAFLFKDAKKSMVYISDSIQKGYRKIITGYNVVEKYSDNTCLLDITLHTGRTHQIRAHLAHIGYPIIGDGKYGKNDINKQFAVKTQKLCSYKLKFNFKEDANILNYLDHKEFKIKYHF